MGTATLPATCTSAAALTVNSGLRAVFRRTVTYERVIPSRCDVILTSARIDGEGSERCASFYTADTFKCHRPGGPEWSWMMHVEVAESERHLPPVTLPDDRLTVQG